MLERVKLQRDFDPVAVFKEEEEEKNRKEKTKRCISVQDCQKKAALCNISFCKVLHAMDGCFAKTRPHPGFDEASCHSYCRMHFFFSSSKRRHFASLRHLYDLRLEQLWNNKSLCFLVARRCLGRTANLLHEQPNGYSRKTGAGFSTQKKII